MPPSHGDGSHVDLVIPAAEPAGDLLRAVQSALGQSAPLVEILDGRGRGSPAAARAFQILAPR